MPFENLTDKKPGGSSVEHKNVFAIIWAISETEGSDCLFHGTVIFWHQKHNAICQKNILKKIYYLRWKDW